MAGLAAVTVRGGPRGLGHDMRAQAADMDADAGGRVGVTAPLGQVPREVTAQRAGTGDNGMVCAGVGDGVRSVFHISRSQGPTSNVQDHGGWKTVLSSSHRA